MVLFLLRSDGAQLYDCGVFERGAIFENKVCQGDESWGWQEAGTDLWCLELDGGPQLFAQSDDTPPKLSAFGKVLNQTQHHERIHGQCMFAL